jgi:formiminoglutamase
MSYHPAQPWQGRIDPHEGARAKRFHQCVTPVDLSAPISAPAVATAAFIGFACDAGVARNQGRIGAAGGPAAVRAALANMAWHHDGLQLWDAGTVTCAEDNLERAQADYAKAVASLLTLGVLPIGLGGGHEIAWGSYCGIEHASHAHDLAIVNFDAHLDLRALTHTEHGARGSSGTPFRQIAERCQHSGLGFHYACSGISRAANTQALFDFADAQRVLCQFDEDLRTHLHASATSALRAFLEQHAALYLSLCMDVFPAAHAPGVSAPAAMGVTPEVIETLLCELVRTGKLRMLDIAELNPLFDQDQRTAKLAARMIWQALRVFRDAHGSN